MHFSPHIAPEECSTEAHAWSFSFPFEDLLLHRTFSYSPSIECAKKIRVSCKSSKAVGVSDRAVGSRQGPESLFSTEKQVSGQKLTNGGSKFCDNIQA